MQISLNGEPKIFEGPMTLQQLLDHVEVAPGRVACEVNLKIIKRAFYGDTLIREGDTVEIIQAIGGG